MKVSVLGAAGPKRGLRSIGLPSNSCGMLVTLNNFYEALRLRALQTASGERLEDYEVF